MRALRALMIGSLLAATGLVQAVPVKQTADFEGLVEPDSVFALPYTENGLNITGNGAVTFGWGVGSELHNALILSEVTQTTSGGIVHGCPSGGCSVTVSFAAGFTGFDFDIAGFNVRGAGAPALEIFGDHGRIGDLMNLTGLKADSECVSGDCKFQNFSFGLASGEVATSFKLTFGTPARWFFDQFSVTPLEASPSRVPEPASLGLVFAALGAAVWTRRRRVQ
jgi:hypothetical protein